MKQNLSCGGSHDFHQIHFWSNSNFQNILLVSRTVPGKGKGKYIYILTFRYITVVCIHEHCFILKLYIHFLRLGLNAYLDKGQQPRKDVLDGLPHAVENYLTFWFWFCHIGFFHRMLPSNLCYSLKYFVEITLKTHI